jgi:hypothetical protein
MPRKANKRSQQSTGLLGRVMGAFKRLTGRGKKSTPAAATTQARTTRRETDIPMDQIENAYTPTQTNFKAPFRASGADRGRDQEFGRGVSDDRWNDEDRLTNKSGDPRIGTHGRTYEPGENAMAAKGRNDE